MQLLQDKQLREEESTSHSKKVFELASGRERLRQLEMELAYLKTLLQNDEQKVLAAREQVTMNSSILSQLH